MADGVRNGTNGTNAYQQAGLDPFPAYQTPRIAGPLLYDAGNRPIYDGAAGETISPFSEIGLTGLSRYSGWVTEEFLPELRGRRGMRLYREMKDNDPTIGALLFAVEMMARQATWKITASANAQASVERAVATVGAPVEDPDAVFIKQCLFEDMNQPWQETLAEILSMLAFGWSWLEIVYKQRHGPQPADAGVATSRFNDGRIGWRKWAIRAQETLFMWVFDGSGGIQAMRQQPPPTFQTYAIPIEKSLLFRPTTIRNNPEGRALAMDTPIPSPDGWRLFGELRPGDRLFDEQGDIRHVVARSDVWLDRPCWRLTFSSGDVVIADAEHLWATQTRRDGEPQLRTTQQIVDTLKTTQGASRHAILRAKPLRYVAQHLPVDPWALGYWLGDGHAFSGAVTAHEDDASDVMHGYGGAGYPILRSQRQGDTRGWFIGVGGGFQRALRGLGVLGRKHVPTAYLQASEFQRVMLLRGLMDSDGTVDDLGRCAFTNVNPDLINGVAELLRSLGQTCRISWRRRIKWQPIGRVKFTPSDGFTPFTLDRKARRCKTVRARARHYVTHAEQIESVPVQCIEVDSPSGLFLAGRAMIPTHNSVLRNAYRPWYMKRRIEEIEGIGVERDLAGLPVMIPPQSLDLWNTTDANAVRLKAQAEKIVRSVRRDEQEGLLLPYGWEFKLLTTGGRRTFDTSEIVGRYDQRILNVVLADFIMLGQQRVGSYALSKTKGDFFSLAMSAYLDAIAGVINLHAIPRLMALNGRPPDLSPVLTHEEVQEPNLDELSNYILRVSQAGAMFPDPGLETALRQIARLPLPAAEEDMLAKAGPRKADKLGTAVEDLLSYVRKLSPREPTPLPAPVTVNLRGAMEPEPPPPPPPPPVRTRKQVTVQRDADGALVGLAVDDVPLT